mgnify:FL=1
MNTEFKVRNIRTIGDISIAAGTLAKIIGGDLTVKLKVPLDMIYDGKTKTIDFAEVFDKSLIGTSPVRGDMRLPPSPDCNDAMVSALMASAMRPMPIGDDQDHIGE